MTQVSREYSSDLKHLPQMRAFVEQVCRTEWLEPEDEKAICHLLLALTEAAANIVEHAYKGEEGRPIVLLLEMDPSRACLTLFHEGMEFDPTKVAPPVFNGSRERGFGVYLIGRLTDEVCHFRSADGRCGMRMVKNRTPSPAGTELCP